jgi:hypothetical protein
VYSDTTPQIQQIEDNMFIFQSDGETITEHCEGRYDTTMILEPGTYLITTKPLCTLKTSLGYLTAIVQFETHRTVNVSEIEPFNFRLDKLIDFGKIQQLPETHFSDQSNQGLHPLDLVPTIEPIGWHNWEISHAPAVTAGGVSIVGISVAIIILCCYVPACRKKCFACTKYCSSLTVSKARQLILPTSSHKQADNTYECAEYSVPRNTNTLYSKGQPTPVTRQTTLPKQTDMPSEGPKIITQDQPVEANVIINHPLYPTLGI